MAKKFKFNEIIRNLLWKFLAEFWKRVKIDLYIFLLLSY